MIVLRGLAERAFGNYLCIRGYAKLGDLVNISRTEAHFQRELNQEHKEEITKFYDYGKNVFFSEVVLGLNVNSDLADFAINDSIELFKKTTNKNAVFQLKNEKFPRSKTTDVYGEAKSLFTIFLIVKQ